MIAPSQLIASGSFIDQTTLIGDWIACKEFTLDEAIKYVKEVQEQISFKFDLTKGGEDPDENARFGLHILLWQEFLEKLVEKNEETHILELPQIRWLLENGYVMLGDPGTVRTRRGIREIVVALKTSKMPQLREDYVFRVFRQANGKVYSRQSLHQMFCS